MSPREQVEMITRRQFAPEMWDTGIHALVVLLVVAAVTVLGVLHDTDHNTVALIYGTAIGYASGRSGTTRRPPGPMYNDIISPPADRQTGGRPPVA